MDNLPDLKEAKPKLLLHICCAPCGAYVLEELKKEYDVALFFFNPNIFPEDEFEKRLSEVRKIAERNHCKLIVGECGHGDWLGLVKGREDDPEKGARCRICYQMRLKESARIAKREGFAYFSTTLTISPWKDATAIISSGNEIASDLGIGFLGRDFKADGGYARSVALSKELGLYRQKYCGCEFSRR